jgi:hypothetical protein
MSDRPTNNRTAARILLAACATIISLVAAELALNWCLTSVASPRLLQKYGSVKQIRSAAALRFAAHPYLPFIPAPNYAKGLNRHNALGFRGDEVAVPKPDGVYRIVLLGGSTTYSTGIDDYGKSYPVVLQQGLRASGHGQVEVVNAGCSMYSSWESLINLQFRVLDLEPDLVIVYHGINDVHPRFVHPASAYTGDNHGSRMAFIDRPQSAWDCLALLRVVRTVCGQRRGNAGMGVFQTYHGVETNHADQFELQKKGGTYPAGIFESVPAHRMLADNPPVFFERNLRSIAGICQAQNIDCMLMTFAVSSQFIDEPRVTSEEYTSAYVEQNEVVRGLAGECQIPCLDFAAVMPHDREYWEDGRHVTEVGAVVKAEFVANFVRTNFLQPTGGEDP